MFVEVFYDLTSQFSKKSSVKLKKKFIPELCEAKTPDELLALETSHKVKFNFFFLFIFYFYFFFLLSYLLYFLFIGL